jgi:hypothetical protein
MLTLSYCIPSLTGLFIFSFIPSEVIPVMWTEYIFFLLDYWQWDIRGHPMSSMDKDGIAFITGISCS